MPTTTMTIWMPQECAQVVSASNRSLAAARLPPFLVRVVQPFQAMDDAVSNYRIQSLPSTCCFNEAASRERYLATVPPAIPRARRDSGPEKTTVSTRSDDPPGIKLNE